MEGVVEQPSNIVEQYGDAQAEGVSMVIVGFDEEGQAWVRHRNTFGDWTKVVAPEDVVERGKEGMLQYFGTRNNLDNSGS